MSTVAKLYLKDRSDLNIKKINLQLKELGYPSLVFDHILYGPFPSPSHLDHYAKWLSHDLEGLQVIKHFERPITRALLESFPWNEIGCFFLTLNGMSEKDIQECQILFNFSFNNPDLFDWSRSNSSRQLLEEYGFNFNSIN